MYRLKEILCALDVVGWRQHYDTEEMAINPTLTECSSGIMMQDIHPMLTLENLISVAPDRSKRTYEEWNGITTYSAGKVVKLKRLYANKDFNEDFGTESGYGLYRCIKECQGINPELDTEHWEHVNFFSEWLKEKTNAGIQKAITRFVTSKEILNNAKTILESKTFFDNAGRITDVVRKTHSLVGFEIIPVRSEGVTCKLEKVGLQFNKNGRVTLYLYHTSQIEPIDTFEFEYTKNGGLQWFNLTDTFLPYLSENTDAGGSWFLCYDEDELPDDMLAVQKNRDWSKAPCRSCSSSEYYSWQAWSQWLEVHPFKTARTQQMWDVANNIYTYECNYGLNAQVTMLCDITDIIIRQKLSFADVISKQVAYDLLREMAYNPNFRINRTQQNFSRDEVLYELDGDTTSNKRSGLGWELEQAYKALDINTDGMSRICLPCKSVGIRYRTI